MINQTPISLRINSRVLKQLDEYVVYRGLARNAIINKAVEMYLSAAMAVETEIYMGRKSAPAKETMMFLREWWPKVDYRASFRYSKL